MKKLITLVLTLTLSAVLAACGGGTTNTDTPAAGDEAPGTTQTTTTP